MHMLFEDVDKRKTRKIVPDHRKLNRQDFYFSIQTFQPNTRHFESEIDF